MSVQVSMLENGMRIVTEAMPRVETVSCGVWVGSGSRNELGEVNGVAHLLEHMAFKGTDRRSSLDIATEKPKPFPWVPDNAWLNVIQLGRSVGVFRDLPDAITRNDAMWKHWYDEDAPESARIPDFEDRIETYFDKLLLVRSALRECPLRLLTCPWRRGGRSTYGARATAPTGVRLPSLHRQQQRSWVQGPPDPLA